MARNARPIRGFEPSRESPVSFGTGRSSGSSRRTILIAGGGKPQRLAGVGIDDDMGRRRAELLPGIEHPGRPDAIDPRAVLDERRLMHVAGQNDVRPVLLDPLSELDIAEIAVAAPTGRRLGRRRMVDPDPPLGPLGRGLGELRADAGLDDRAVPPRADGEQRLVDDEGLAVGQDALVLRRLTAISRSSRRPRSWRRDRDCRNRSGAGSWRAAG